jgi:hypothetical protein
LKQENKIVERKRRRRKIKSEKTFELLWISAGIDNDILHTGELHILNYKNAMSGDYCIIGRKKLAKKHDRVIGKR